MLGSGSLCGRRRKKEKIKDVALGDQWMVKNHLDKVQDKIPRCHPERGRAAGWPGDTVWPHPKQLWAFCYQSALWQTSMQAGENKLRLPQWIWTAWTMCVIWTLPNHAMCVSFCPGPKNVFSREGFFSFLVPLRDIAKLTNDFDGYTLMHLLKKTLTLRKICYLLTENEFVVNLEVNWAPNLNVLLRTYHMWWSDWRV